MEIETSSNLNENPQRTLPIQKMSIGQGYVMVFVEVNGQPTVGVLCKEQTTVKHQSLGNIIEKFNGGNVSLKPFPSEQVPPTRRQQRRFNHRNRLLVNPRNQIVKKKKVVDVTAQILDSIEDNQQAKLQQTPISPSSELDMNLLKMALSFSLYESRNKESKSNDTNGCTRLRDTYKEVNLNLRLKRTLNGITNGRRSRK